MSAPGDVERDGLALVQCSLTGDLEGARAVLDNCEVRVVCAFLSRVCADLVEAWTGDDSAEMLYSLRRHYS